MLTEEKLQIDNIQCLVIEYFSVLYMQLVILITPTMHFNLQLAFVINICILFFYGSVLDVLTFIIQI